MRTPLVCAVMVALSCGFAPGQAQYKVLYSFGTNPNDALNISGTLAADHKGNLFGTSQVGGIVPNCDGGGCGVVFELSPSSDGTWTETIPYDFCPTSGCPDGIFPETGVVVDPVGNLYGVTPYGGSESKLCYSFLNFEAGCGVVFELSPPAAPGGAWTYTLLHAFCSDIVGNVCQDGAAPMGGLALDSSGNLYGTTSVGGTGNGGAVFEVSPGTGGWTETVLYSFCSAGGPYCPDGYYPTAAVTLDKSGDLYGTTDIGGSTNSSGGGTLYKLSIGTHGWQETIVYAFPQPVSGIDDLGQVTIDSAHNLYTTFILGTHSYGGVAAVGSQGDVRTFVFNGTDGRDPIGGVVVDSKRRVLYGNTSGIPGFGNGGNVYQIDKFKKETVLYNFCPPNCGDGYLANGGLLEGRSGNLYGTTELGGTYDEGVVFELTP